MTDSDKINLLYCDNEDKKHEMFLEAFEVTKQLTDEQKGMCTIFHSQSLPRTSKQKGDFCGEKAKSVQSWMDDLKTFDLIITDLDFFSNTPMGREDEGLHIIRAIAKEAGRTWSKYVILTANLAKADHRELNSLTEQRLIKTADLLTFDHQGTAASLDQLMKRVRKLLDEIIRKRARNFEMMAAHPLEELYELKIIYQSEPWDQSNPLGVEIREKQGRNQVLRLRLAKAGYIFRALIDAPKLLSAPFALQHEVARIASNLGRTLKAKQADPHERFSTSTIRGHVNDIRVLICESEMKVIHLDGVKPTSKTHAVHNGTICGHKIIESPKKPLEGYRIAGSIEEMYSVDRFTFEEMFPPDQRAAIVDI